MNSSQVAALTSPLMNEKIKKLMSMAVIKITAPIVGVPDFFSCIFGPSSRILWPNFNFTKKGINSGTPITVMIKATAKVDTNMYKDTINSPQSVCQSTSLHILCESEFFFNSYSSFYAIIEINNLITNHLIIFMPFTSNQNNIPCFCHIYCITNGIATVLMNNV